MLQRCAADASCRAEYPDPLGDLDKARRALRTAPANVTIKHPATGAPVQVELSEWGLNNALIQKMYTMNETKALPALFRSVAKGDYRELVENWIARIRDLRSTVALGMNRAIVCNEDVARIEPGEMEKETANTFVGPTMVREAKEICAAYPQAKLPDDYFEPFVSRLPTLITSGEFDPVTPPRWGEEARKSFPNSLHLVAEEGHHFDGSSGCLKVITEQFFRDPEIERIDTSCLADPGDGISLYR